MSIYFGWELRTLFLELQVEGLLLLRLFILDALVELDLLGALVDGLVVAARDLSLDDLLALPTHQVRLVAVVVLLHPDRLDLLLSAMMMMRLKRLMLVVHNLDHVGEVIMTDLDSGRSCLLDVGDLFGENLD